MGAGASKADILQSMLPESTAVELPAPAAPISSGSDA